MITSILSVFGPLLLDGVDKWLQASAASDAMKKQFYEFVQAFDQEKPVSAALRDSAKSQLDRLKAQLNPPTGGASS